MWRVRRRGPSDRPLGNRDARGPYAGLAGLNKCLARSNKSLGWAKGDKNGMPPPLLIFYRSTAAWWSKR